MPHSSDDLRLVTTEGGAELAQSVSCIAGAALHRVETLRFPNENLACRLPDLAAEGRDVHLFQSFSSAVSERVLELLFALRALAARAPRRLTAVLPYLAYSRSDCAEAPGEPVPARELAELIEWSGAQRVICFDLHSPQLAGFFHVPVLELSARPILARALAAWKLEDPIVMSPDLGGAKRAKRFAAELGWPVGILTKQRTRTSVEIRSLAGDPRGRSVVLFDDEIATGGTLVAAAEAVLAAGARQVHAVATHGVFTPGALELLERSPLERILVCDTVPRAHSSAKLEVVSIAAELASLLRGKPSA